MLKGFPAHTVHRLTKDPRMNQTPILSGYQLGRNRLIKHLEVLRGLEVSLHRVASQAARSEPRRPLTKGLSGRHPNLRSSL